MSGTPFDYVGDDPVELLADELEGELQDLTRSLRAVRDLRGLSLQDLSDLTGISNDVLSRFEAGIEDFDSDMLLSYALAVRARIHFHVEDYEESCALRKLAKVALLSDFRRERRESVEDDVARYMKRQARDAAYA